MDKFLKAYNITIGHEGGYVNDPDDRGGETYKGIARKHWPHWKGWELLDMIKDRYGLANINSSLARNTGMQNYVQQFYYENFWLPLQCDSFHFIIASELFDTAVNQGVGTSAKYLQQALNKLNRNQKDYPDLKVDGGIGLITKEAYKSYFNTARFASRNSEKLLKWILRWLNYYQLKRYDLITNKDLTQEKFIPGWTERT